MRLKIFLALSLFALLVSACAPAAPAPQPFSVTDMRGTAFDFPQPVQKIISLAPANTEILFAIGAGKQMVGRDSLSDYPEEAKTVADIGGGFGALNTELIVAAQPDLIVAGDLTPAEQIKTLEDLGLKVFVLRNPANLTEMYENLTMMAKITGHEQETATLVASLQAREKAVNDKLAGLTERPQVLYELDGTDPNAPWVPGPGTFVDTIIKQAGGDSISASLDGAWVQMSIEAIIQKDPAMIILGDFTWGGVTPEMVAQRTGWDALSAVKNNQVYTFDDNLISRPGPRMVDGLEAMAILLHPELFK
jgi:iron complex transport system substrate-binding protein